MIKQFTSLSADTANKPKVLLDLRADWCVPCKRMEPSLKRIAEEHPEIDIVMVDVEANLAVTQQLGISSIPTIVYYENGQQIASLAGFQPYDRIKALLGV